jgi:hypothetical protein
MRIVPTEPIGLVKKMKPMTKQQYGLITIPKDHSLLAACLNLVSKRGITPDEALARVTEAGIPFDIICQWSDRRQELDVVAVFKIARIGESPLTDKQDRFLWDLFGNESLLCLVARKHHDCKNVMVRDHIKFPPPEPPPYPDGYLNPGLLQLG